MSWVGTTWDAVYGWFASLTAEGWAALGTWVAVLVALATVVVAGVYAARQVSEAQTLRREQAQPNVVMYTQVNPYVSQMLELVVKNFGNTPAYNITMEFDPTPQVSPESVGEGATDLAYPSLIPILAPEQEWRTWWDSAVARKDAGLVSRHEATVRYADNHGARFETMAVLDWDYLIGTTWVGVKNIHDLTKLLDRKLKEQNDLLTQIGKALNSFTTEHEGVWVYGDRDDRERDYRARVAEQRAAQSAQNRQRLDALIQRATRSQAPTPTDADGTQPRSTPQEPATEFDQQP